MSSSVIPPLYDIEFYGDHIWATVTSTPSVVNEWISNTKQIHRHRLHKLVVGLDTEWCLPSKFNPHQKVAILQLCVGKRCLIYQVSRANFIPSSLRDFLGNKNFSFVGKGVEEDATKLFQDYGIYVANTKDVADWASEKYHDTSIRRMGLKTLVEKFLEKVIPKPRKITMSRWNVKELTIQQIEYACLDAFVSFQLGILLSKNNNVAAQIKPPSQKLWRVKEEPVCAETN